jgi:hypothetical protein
MTPTMAPADVLGGLGGVLVNADDRTIIITVVITLLSVMFAGGYIIYLTLTEGRDTSGADGLAAGESGMFGYDEDDSGDCEDNSAPMRMHYYYNDSIDAAGLPNHESANGGRERPRSTLSSSATKTASSADSAVDDASTGRSYPPDSDRANSSVNGSDRDRAGSGHGRSRSVTNSIDAMEGSNGSIHNRSHPVVGYTVASDPRSSRGDDLSDSDESTGGVDVEGVARYDSSPWSGSTSRRRSQDQLPSPLAFSGFQMEVLDLED